MKVAVITPYYRTPLAWLHQCHRSVKAQSHPCTHILVADGEPLDNVDELDAQHIRSVGPNRDYGNAARSIGSVAAIRQGFDAICFLDADNWFRPDHVALMVALHRESRVPVCTSSRALYHVDGTYLGQCLESDGETFVDTNCMFLTRQAFPVASVWHTMDRRLDGMGDRVVWFQIKQLGMSTAHSDQPSVSYRTSFREHYEHCNAIPPPDAKSAHDLYPARKLFEELKAKALGKEGWDPTAIGIDRPIASQDGMLPSIRSPQYTLISLIGLPRAQLDRLLDNLVEDCAANDRTPVFVTDEVDLAVSLSQTQLVEHIPSAGSRDAFAPDLDWDLYIERRLKQIQEKWRVPHVIALGLPLDAVTAHPGRPSDQGRVADLPASTTSAA